MKAKRGLVYEKPDNTDSNSLFTRVEYDVIQAAIRRNSMLYKGDSRGFNRLNQVLYDIIRHNKDTTISFEFERFYERFHQRYKVDRFEKETSIKGDIEAIVDRVSDSAKTQLNHKLAVKYFTQEDRTQLGYLYKTR